MEEVHVQTTAQGRSGSETLVAAADLVEPDAAECEIVAAADVPRHRAPLVGPRLGADAGRDRVAPRRRRPERQDPPAEERELGVGFEGSRDLLEPVVGGDAVVIDHCDDRGAGGVDRVVLRGSETSRPGAEIPDRQSLVVQLLDDLARLGAAALIGHHDLRRGRPSFEQRAQASSQRRGAVAGRDGHRDRRRGDGHRVSASRVSPAGLGRLNRNLSRRSQCSSRSGSPK